jgi:hypothetical protein
MTKPAVARARRSGTVRCAIYTRKSSEEGLEQEFNSLLVETGRRPLWVALDSVDRSAVSTESLPNLDRPWVCALPGSVPAPYCRRVFIAETGHE